MKKCLCGTPGGLMAEIVAVQVDQFIEPPKLSGIFEVFEERMNHFEKAVYTVMHRIQQQIETNVNSLASPETASDKKGAIESEIKVLADKFAMAKGLLYFSIQDRLNRWNIRLGVSQGFKIAIPEETEAVKTISIAIPVPEELAEMLKSVFESSKDEKDIHSDPPSKAFH